MDAPAGLRVEHRLDALGLTEPRPRLSWRLPAGCARQLAYRVRTSTRDFGMAASDRLPRDFGMAASDQPPRDSGTVDSDRLLWDSGKVDSDQSVLVRYDGPALRSGQRVQWTVKVWTDRGESDWAAPSWWEMGLLCPDDWTADWIAPPAAPPVQAWQPYPVWLLRGRVTLPGPAGQARLYVTAQGIYEFFINGIRVGDHELTPGFTSYSSRLQVQAFDVTELLRPGDNTLGAALSGGWVTWRRWTRIHEGLTVGLLAQLDTRGADGTPHRAGTDGDWTAAVGEIKAADLQQGQITDFRAARAGWCGGGDEADGWSARAGGRGAADGWSPVTVFAADRTRLACSPAPPVRRVQQVRPVRVTSPRTDVQVVDLGQNINGWVRLASLGPAGTTTTLTYGEALDAAGDVTTANVAPGEHDPATAELGWDFAAEAKAAFQVDQVTSAGIPGQVFEPRHATHGFRYVRVAGRTQPLRPDSVTGVVVHTDLERTGWFECSDERINRLHEAVVWSMRGNVCDIPTDCPTRERAGWTGDWQVFAGTAAFLYDVAGFSAKWLRDLAAEQQPDGTVGHCAPESTGARIQAALGMPPGCAGFGDAAVIVPWEMYKAYGDRDLLAGQWPSMAAWVEHAARAAAAGRHARRVAERPLAAAHERFLWDTGFHWGEWNEPGAFVSIDSLAAADHGAIATAYLHHSAWLLARIAGILGRDDAGRYASLAEATRSAWRAEFLSPDGAITPGTQASYVRALAFGLAPRRLRPRLAGRLAGLIRQAGTHLGTGFLATGLLLGVLAETGHLDLAYDLLLQDSEPSWLAMIDRGATTIWEHWTGLDGRGLPAAPPGVGSLNHYSKGAVASFLHRHIAGIRLLGDGPGYRKFLIAPQPGGGLTWARAVHDCPYGRIESSWRVEGGDFRLDVEVPPGTVADVWLPDGRVVPASPGGHVYECVLQERADEQ